MQRRGLESETTNKKILTRLEMTENVGEPGRSRTRNSRLKALQAVLEGIGALSEWTLAWTKRLPSESEAKLWLKADIVPLVEETTNEDGSSKVKLRPVAPLETPMALRESIAVDQAAGHLVTWMQTPHVWF